jgi:hypothetical protein
MARNSYTVCQCLLQLNYKHMKYYVKEQSFYVYVPNLGTYCQVTNEMLEIMLHKTLVLCNVKRSFNNNRVRAISEEIKGDVSHQWIYFVSRNPFPCL